MSRKATLGLSALAFAVLGAIVWARRPVAPSGTGLHTAGSDGTSGTGTEAPKLGTDRAQPASPKLAPSAALMRLPMPSASARTPDHLVAWGAQGLGRDTDQKPSRGAGSFSVDAQGNTLVLDDVTHRVVTVGPNGKILRSTPLPGKSADDVVATKDGKLLVTDRSGAGTIHVVDPSGRSTAFDLTKAGIENPRDVSRVVERGGRVFVQQNGNGPLAFIGDTQGTVAAPGSAEQGIPTRDGAFLVSAGVTNMEAGRVWVNLAKRQGAAHVWTRELRFEPQITAVPLVDTDDHGRVYVVALGETANGGTLTNWLTCLRQDTGQPISTQSFPVQGPWRSFRDFEVRAEGGLVVALKEDEGLRLTTIQCETTP
jgi:hypothetical protein